MPRHKSTIYRPRAARVYLAPAASLFIWLGVGATGWFSIDHLTRHRLSTNQSPASAVKAHPHRGDPLASRAPSPLSPDKNKSDAPVQARTPQPKRPALRQNVAQGLDTPSPSVSSLKQSTTGPITGDRDSPSSDDISTPTSDTADKNPGAKIKPADRGPAAGTSAEPVASRNVARAQLTSGIAHREPVDRIIGVFHSQHEPLRRLYYFTEITGMRGKTVTHKWWHKGRLIATIRFRIGSNSWRIYSRKRFTPSMAGAWRVVTNDSRGHILSSARFIYKVP